MHKIDLSDTRQRVFPKILHAQAQDNGGEKFLVTDELTVTFAEADRISDSLASGLAGLGLARGGRLCLFMGSRPEMVLLTLAANKLGAIWVPVNTDYKGEWLLDTLQRSRADVLVTDAAHYAEIESLADRFSAPQLVVLGGSPPAGASAYETLANSAPLQSDYDELDYGDTCAILWTSGTTGKSKGAMQNYNGWIRAIVDGASPQYGSRDGDIIFCVLPLFNAGAWVTCVYRALIEGIPCVLEPRYSVQSFWSRLKHFGATQTFVIGAMGVYLWNAEPRDDDADNPLRIANIVPFPPDKWRAFEERFGVTLLRSGLGQSECQLVMNHMSLPESVPVYALGAPPEDLDVQLCDDDGNEVADGEPGEICVRPLQPNILFNGYFDDPEATANSFRGEYFLTGDLARRDPESGAYFFVDRKKDALRRAGRNISTMEVESVVRRHDAIADVAAFGIASEEVESEQDLKLNVVLKPGTGLSAEELCDFLADNAPYWFVPRYIDFVDALPYTPTNKVQKFKLRQAGVGEATWDQNRAGYKVKR